ncbi:Folylpolyglutamate synthase [Nymphon striatum]|nr:Folylpolyglutamate synthase [Nymphon striatum]
MAKVHALPFACALLEAHGKSVHVHTSPHLVQWHERFRLAGKFVDDLILTDAIKRVAAANAGEHITVFEILTAVMFVLFSEHPADVAIIEVGLGGRADATNIIEKPAASVIMPIGLDHEAYLGDTIEKIAAEKGGIIKRHVPLIIGAQPRSETRDVLESIAVKLRSPTKIYGQDFHAYEEHGRMVFQGDTGLSDLPMPSLVGRHQIANAAAAIMAVRAAGFDLSDHEIEHAMGAVSWPARMQKLKLGPLTALAPERSDLWLDGGHNPDAAVACAEYLANLEETVERPIFMICGMINTKDAVGYFKPFEGLVRHVFTVPVPSSDAGVDPAILSAQAIEAGLSAEPIDSVQNALKILGDDWNVLERSPRILISGSLYLAGDVLRDNQTPPE